ncbi:GntR family transcriptional regulator [Variovorax sp. J22R115]|uniref:GntR family transcriptional regulator n=1 Tax=Variovorax sp. J22R115 TaxID=3053509 RepID=UPI002577B66F|nr:GntR family transcriptional regulator [Variovorax sp. J22R115]MDM0051506.1 GntR family transcriptional regulator [Variovorax sp. J22R115]
MKKSVADDHATYGAEAEATPTRAGSAGRQLMSLAEQIAERIFTSIASGEYAPGDRIREETIAEQLDVSRGPVREALRILEKDSVVRIQPNRGAHVTQLTIKEVGDLFEIRRDLIGAMVRRLAPHNDDLIAAIDAGVCELESVGQGGGGAEAYLVVSNRLGRLLADASRNERLAEIVGSLARQTRRYSMLGLASAARRKESARTWRAMVGALKAGDANAAADAVEDLIDALRREAIRQLALPLPTRTKD